MGVPPHWNLYVTVPSADDAADTRRRRSAPRCSMPPFDVMHQGRMAIIRDPTGAVLQLWRAKAHIGVKIRNEPNSLCWSELTTKDPKAAEAFYTGMFGWSAKHSAPAAVMDYTEFSVNGQPSRRDDGDAREHAAARALVLDAVLPGGGSGRIQREGQEPRRERHGRTEHDPGWCPVRDPAGSAEGDVRACISRSQ